MKEKKTKKNSHLCPTRKQAPLDINHHHKFIAHFFFFEAADIKSSSTQPASLSSVPDRAVRLQ